LLDELELFDNEAIDEHRDDGDGQQVEEVEQDELGELVIPHTTDNGDELEMDEFESLLQFQEQVYIMLEDDEDECIMVITQQSDDNEAVDYEVVLHFQQ